MPVCIGQSPVTRHYLKSAPWWKQAWEGDYEGADVLSKALVLSKGSEEPVGQGRCSGFGGGFKAVKISGGCGGSEASEDHIEQPKAESKEMDMFRLQRKSLLDMAIPVHLPRI